MTSNIMNMEINTQEEGNAVFIQVKQERLDSENIKEEPPDDYYSYEVMEDVTVKIEPSNDDEEVTPNLEERYHTLPQRPHSPIQKTLRPRRVTKNVRNYCDEDYLESTSKKGGKGKGKEIVKKTYTTKAKRTENDYSEEITKHIQVISISEEERLTEFKEAWHARQHMRYTCELCAVGFVTREPYTAHMQMHSPESGDHECDICQCRMQSAEVLYRHRLRHYRRYRCSLCRAVHKEKETASSHIMTEHCGRSFVCTHCGKGYKRPAYLRNHIAQQHTKAERHECPVCRRVLHDKASLRSHVRIHDEQTRDPPVQIVVCDVCSQRFRGKTRLRKHMRLHLTRVAEVCACGARFNTRRGLALHQAKQHQAKRAKPAACQLCERVCASAALLRQHVRRMHSDRTKKYQCDHCLRHYFSKGELRAHIAWSHLRAAAHACRCGRAFRTRARLAHHQATRHAGVAPPRSHVCHCGKGFTSKQVLSRHMKCHEGLTYPCPECGLRFKSEPYVKVHYQLRHLNMTRAQIKALKQPRTLIYVNGTRPMKSDSDTTKNDKVKKKAKSGKKVQSANVEQVQSEVQNEEGDIRVPLFDFVDLKREIVDSPQNYDDSQYEEGV